MKESEGDVWVVGSSCEESREFSDPNEGDGAIYSWKETEQDIFYLRLHYHEDDCKGDTFSVSKCIDIVYFSNPNGNVSAGDFVPGTSQFTLAALSTTQVDDPLFPTQKQKETSAFLISLDSDFEQPRPTTPPPVDTTSPPVSNDQSEKTTPTLSSGKDKNSSSTTSWAVIVFLLAAIGCVGYFAWKYYLKKKTEQTKQPPPGHRFSALESQFYK